MLGKKKKSKNKKQKNNYNEPVLPVIEEDLFSTGSKTDFSKSLEVMYNDENPEKKTDLSPKQIAKLNQIKQMGEYYDIPLLIDLYDRFIALRVSKSRKGRTEGVSMTQQIAQFKRLEALESLESRRK